MEEEKLGGAELEGGLLLDWPSETIKLWYGGYLVKERRLEQESE